MANKETGIWDDRDLAKGHKHDTKLAQALMDMYRPNRMADLGCGDGWYCSYFKEGGWPIVHGYEGHPPKEALYDDIMVMDLSKVRHVGITYDLVICLEVGEHIPKKHEQKFLDNIARFARWYLVLSWAVPGQGGRGHFNERPNSYIIDEMGKRDFYLNKEGTKTLRGSSELSWFRSSIMVFDAFKSI